MDPGNLVEDIKQAWIGELVEHEPALTPVRNKAGFAQRHQVLGQIRLPPPQYCLQVADTSLALSKSQQDFESHGVTGSL